MDDDYQDKSPAAGRMGKAAELLVAASCILATRGELNVSTALVDDDGLHHPPSVRLSTSGRRQNRFSTDVIHDFGTVPAL